MPADGATDVAPWTAVTLHTNGVVRRGTGALLSCYSKGLCYVVLYYHTYSTI